MENSTHNGTTTLQLVLAWGFVGIPLVLGVLQTLVNAMKLFQKKRPVSHNENGPARARSHVTMAEPLKPRLRRAAA